MKHLFVLALFLIGVLPIFASPPPFSAITSMTIVLPTNWRLEIKSNGSGVIGLGANGANYGKFSLNTINLREVYQKLSTQIDGGPAKPDQIVVSFVNDRDCESFNTKSADYILQLMNVAYENALFIDKNRVDNLRLKRPFQP